VSAQAVERTLAIIKPDAVAKGVVGRILTRIEEAGFRIVAMKMVHLTERQAAGFYVVHRERPFYRSLCAFMSQGPAVVLVLEGEGAIQRWRDLMGATDPAQAAPGTLRREFAASIEANAVHGSDSAAAAAFEIPYFFSQLELPAR
jgi:nucleoside-diphosphate kinase